MKHELEMLGKRNDDLKRRNSETMIELEKVKRDNKKLHASSQEWYKKYNDAMFIIESRTNLFKTKGNTPDINRESSNSLLFTG